MREVSNRTPASWPVAGVARSDRSESLAARFSATVCCAHGAVSSMDGWRSAFASPGLPTPLAIAHRALSPSTLLSNSRGPDAAGRVQASCASTRSNFCKFRPLLKLVLPQEECVRLGRFVRRRRRRRRWWWWSFFEERKSGKNSTTRRDSQPGGV